MTRLTLIVGIRIRVEIWVRVRLWVRLDSYDYSNIKDCPHQQGPCEVKSWRYRTILRVVVWFRGCGFRMDAGVAFGVDARVGFGVEAMSDSSIKLSASALLFFLVLVQGVL